MVPLQEEHEARLESRISLSDWMEMPDLEKALLIAVRRNRRAIDNLINETNLKKMKRESRGRAASRR